MLNVCACVWFNGSVGGEIMAEKESSLPYLDENYTGPYLSDGKIQTSVEFGEALPQSKLDKLSRLHDSAYAHWEDTNHREAADRIYKKEAQDLVGLFPQLAGDVVEYGNWTAHAVSNLASDVATGGKYGGLLGAFVGLLVGGVENMYHLNDTLMNGEKYEKEVKAYYETDPFKNDSRYRNVANSATVGVLPGTPSVGKENKNKNYVYVGSAQESERPFNYRRKQRKKRYSYL